MMERVETRLDGTHAGRADSDALPASRRAASGSSRLMVARSRPATKPQPDGTLVKALARAWRWQRHAR